MIHVAEGTQYIVVPAKLLLAFLAIEHSSNNDRNNASLKHSSVQQGCFAQQSACRQADITTDAELEAQCHRGQRLASPE